MSTTAARPSGRVGRSANLKGKNSSNNAIIAAAVVAHAGERLVGPVGIPGRARRPPRPNQTRPNTYEVDSGKFLRAKVYATEPLDEK